MLFFYRIISESINAIISKSEGYSNKFNKFYNQIFVLIYRIISES